MDHLLLNSPVRIGSVEARNRVFFAPTSVGYAEDGYLTARSIEHYGRRAAGGVGAVMTEHFAVSEDGWQHPRQPGAWSDEHMPSMRLLADEIHAHGAVAIAQLSHAGRYAGPWDDYHARRRLAPSAISFPLPTGSVCPDEITTEEIAAATSAFALATARAIACGFDGVELHGSSGFLLSSFVSPLMNQREDEYGGSLENRFRFSREVVVACRQVVAPGIPIGYHLMAEELMPHGATLDDALALVPVLEAAGIDFFRPASGTFEAFRAPHNAGRSSRAAFEHVETQAINAVATVPVMAGGGIWVADLAESILARDEAQIIALSRPLLADPDWLTESNAGAIPQRCLCHPPQCLSTQLTGTVCSRWPSAARERGVFGYGDNYHHEGVSI